MATSPHNPKLDELAALVQTGRVDGDRLHEHVNAAQLVPLHRVHEHLPLSRWTILRWERAGLITIYRPNSRRSFVHIDDLMHAWQACAGGEHV